MDIFYDIRDWAIERNLIDGSEPRAQMLKLMEECGELAAAIARNDQEEVIDAIGDVIVVLTILAYQREIFVEDAIAHAYEQIKDRKGRMVDGVFIKEEPSK